MTRCFEPKQFADVIQDICDNLSECYSVANLTKQERFVRLQFRDALSHKRPISSIYYGLKCSTTIPYLIKRKSGPELFKEVLSLTHYGINVFVVRRTEGYPGWPR